ncbi:unnamed protein product [Arabidopsis lyrata]|nr:unnamed protein product [Arabidopsis lyrata]
METEGKAHSRFGLDRDDMRNISAFQIGFGTWQLNEYHLKREMVRMSFIFAYGLYWTKFSTYQ